MSTAHKVPLVAKPQKLSISLAGTTYSLLVRWCRAASAWVLDLGDVNGNPIVNGIPLVTGSDLLAQYAYLGIGGQLIVQTDNNADAVPTFANLGSQGNLYFVTTP